MARKFIFGGSFTSFVYDVDAFAFISAGGITDEAEKKAVNQLVLDLKSNGLWSKLKAIYPFVGATINTNKFNLKDPRDLDVAFRLTFSGGWAFSNNGALPNGINAYANTHFTPLGNQSLLSGHFALYSRTASGSLSQFGGSGVSDTNQSRGANLSIRRKSGGRVWVMWDESSFGGLIVSSETDGRGFYLGSRISNSDNRFYKNGMLIASNLLSQTATSLSTNSYYLSVFNRDGSPLLITYDNKELAFASIGDGLTSSESLTLYTIVQTFQTALNRQV